MRTDDFDYDLPERCIAQEPAPVRDACRLLVMDRETGALADRIFRDIEGYLNPGDLLVANSTRVMPARDWPRRGHRAGAYSARRPDPRATVGVMRLLREARARRGGRP